MINNKFELYKVCREIKRSGKSFDFYRYDLNDFGEPITEPSSDTPRKKILTLNGLYHEHTAHLLDTYIILTTQGAGAYRINKTRQILCLSSDLYDEDGNFLLNVDTDYVMFNGHLAKFTGMKDVMEWGLVTDLSFGEVDYGKR